MKKFSIITGIVFAAAVILASCDHAHRSPGRAYMPDMTYSRAWETYADTTDRLQNSGASYSARPVAGTIARGDMMPYSLKNDSVGYALSAANKNPLDMKTIDMKNAERLYLINCGICHGAKLDGNGPLYNGGNGPYTAAPKNFMDPATLSMSEGTMFHVATFGKGQMGSYASQLNTKQRWEVVAYIKSKQNPGGAAPAPADSSAAKPAAGKDSTGVATK